jgi:hypothetical protein
MNESPISNPFDQDERLGRRPIFWAVLGLTAICFGILFAGAFFYLQPDVNSLYAQYFPSATSTASSTPAPTATNTPTPTPNWTATAQVENAFTAAEDAVSTWDVILADTFDSNDNNWLEESNDDDFALTDYQVVDGKYRWESTAHQSFIGWVRAGRESLTDFHLSVDIHQIDAPASADYGVVFREDDDSNFYYFAVTDAGEYALYMFFEEWDTLIDWTETNLINAGEVNRIIVLGEGSHFTFFINDQYLTEITNDLIPEGLTALAIELDNEGDQGTFEFDNFELRSP